MLIYFTANTIAEITCLVFAIVCLIKDNSFIWRCMILYLLITCITEITGIYISHRTHNNHWVYNIFLLFEAGFTNLMFANLFSSYTQSKLIIKAGLVIFIVLYFYEIS